jgi:hypothetical protein
MTMDTGHKFGLWMMYSVIAMYTLVMLRILIQILFGAAIEDHRRRQWRKQHGDPAHTYRAMAGKGGWANSWLPQNTAAELSPSKPEVTTGRSALSLLVTPAAAIVVFLITVGMAPPVAAQHRSAREASSSDLKKQLIDIQAREIPLRIRLEEIDQALQPESIERDLAGIGSVHPEQLRENRRRLLTIERNGLQAQLDLLEELRARVEAAMANDEDATKYLKDETPVLKRSPPPQMAVTLRNFHRAAVHLQKLLGAFAIAVVLAGAFMLLLFIAIQKLAEFGIGKRQVQRTLLKWAIRFGYTG